MGTAMVPTCDSGDGAGQHGAMSELQAVCSQEPSSSRAEEVAHAVVLLLGDGLRGNRMVGAQPWAVVKAMCRSFPLLLATSVAAAEEAVALTPPQSTLDDDARVHAWALHALATGITATFLTKLASQPQITAAYAPGAPARSKQLLSQAADMIKPWQEALSQQPRAAPASLRHAPACTSADDGAVGDTRGAAATRHIQTDTDVLAAKHEAAATAVARLPFALPFAGGAGAVGDPGGGARQPSVAPGGGHTARSATAAHSSLVVATSPPAHRLKVALHVVPSDAGDFVVVELSVVAADGPPDAAAAGGMASWVAGAAASCAGALPPMSRLARGLGHWGGGGSGSGGGGGGGGISPPPPPDADASSSVSSSSRIGGLTFKHPITGQPGNDNSSTGDAAAALPASGGAVLRVHLTVSSSSPERPVSLDLQLEPGGAAGTTSDAGWHVAPPAAHVTTVGRWMNAAASSVAALVPPTGWPSGGDGAPSAGTSGAAAGGAAAGTAGGAATASSLGVPGVLDGWAGYIARRGAGWSAVGERGGGGGGGGGGAANARDAACVDGDDDDLDLLMLEDMRMVLAGGSDGGAADGGSGCGGGDGYGDGAGGTPTTRADVRAPADAARRSAVHDADAAQPQPTDPAVAASVGAAGVGAAGVGAAGVGAQSVGAAGVGASACAADASCDAAGRCRPYGVAIRLHFDLHPACSEQQQWHAQGGRCAACKEALQQPGAAASGLRAGRGFAAAAYLWGTRGSGAAAPDAPAGRGASDPCTHIGEVSSPPRLCWYTGRLFCRHCHHQHAAVIPAHVLRRWDLTPRPVCCAAHEYLAAVCEQPLLCVTAINPGLYAKVALLRHARHVRARLRDSLARAAASGPPASDAASALATSAGMHAYLLGSMEDFWSLADLVDLSKGPLSTLSRWLDDVDEKAAALVAHADHEGPR